MVEAWENVLVTPDRQLMPKFCEKHWTKVYKTILTKILPSPSITVVLLYFRVQGGSRCVLFARFFLDLSREGVWRGTFEDFLNFRPIWGAIGESFGFHFPYFSGSHNLCDFRSILGQFLVYFGSGFGTILGRFWASFGPRPGGAG